MTILKSTLAICAVLTLVACSQAEPEMEKEMEVEADPVSSKL